MRDRALATSVRAILGEADGRRAADLDAFAALSVDGSGIREWAPDTEVVWVYRAGLHDWDWTGSSVVVTAAGGTLLAIATDDSSKSKRVFRVPEGWTVDEGWPFRVNTLDPVSSAEDLARAASENQLSLAELLTERRPARRPMLDALATAAPGIAHGQVSALAGGDGWGVARVESREADLVLVWQDEYDDDDDDRLTRYVGYEDAPARPPDYPGLSHPLLVLPPVDWKPAGYRHTDYLLRMGWPVNDPPSLESAVAERAERAGLLLAEAMRWVDESDARSLLDDVVISRVATRWPSYKDGPRVAVDTVWVSGQAPGVRGMLSGYVRGAEPALHLPVVAGPARGGGGSSDTGYIEVRRPADVETVLRRQAEARRFRNEAGLSPSLREPSG